MRRFGKKMLVICFALVLSLMAFSQPINAHDLWLNAEDYTPEVGKPVRLTLGYGHYYLSPGSEVMPQEYLDKIYIISPEGRQLKLKAASRGGYKTDVSLQDSGTYLAVATKKAGFSTKTTEGYKRGRSKKGLKNVISCTYSAKYAKAIVNVGKGGGKNFSRPIGHKLEIIPLNDPANLSEGDYFPVKVLYNKEPLRTEIVATYAGFSTEKNTFAYATKTDKEGIGKIKLLKSGIWLIKVGHKAPYPNPKECDQYSFSATLTFEVK